MQVSMGKIAPPVALIIVGFISILIGVIGVWPFGAQPINISLAYQIFLIILGLVLIGFGIFFVWRELSAQTRSTEENNKKEDIKTAQQFLIVGENRVKNLLSITDDNDQILDSLFDYACAHQVKRARIIQYSGVNARRLIRNLLGEKIEVQLLLHHPGRLLQEMIDILKDHQLGEITTYQEYQLGKMKMFQQRLDLSDISNTDLLKIKYYKEQPSIRGVKLDDKYVSIGWYVQCEKREPPYVVPWLYGHNNPAINTELDWYFGKSLGNFFDEMFEKLWKIGTEYDDMNTLLGQISVLDIK